MFNQRIPVTYFVVKVAGRCNLNCSYCYMYNLADQTWRQQPAFMAPQVITALTERVREHCLQHSAKHVFFSLHGGEPLLGNQEYITSIVETLRSLEDSGIEVQFGIQTNGTLITVEWLETLDRLGVNVGLSLDGPAEAHNRYRVDHHGRGSYETVLEGIRLLTKTSVGQRVFGSVLCVVDLKNDPVEVYEHFLSLGLYNMDFLLPDSNYVYFPSGKKDFHDTPYANWLIQIFDRWYEANNPRVSIRIFNSMLSSLLGKGSRIDSLGIEPMGLATIETDGGIEPLDVLKCTTDGLTKLGLNVLTNKLDDLFNYAIYNTQTRESELLSSVCTSCRYHRACGGGYLPHRYDGVGFLNPSVYCSDLHKLYSHISKRLYNSIEEMLRLNQPDINNNGETA